MRKLLEKPSQPADDDCCGGGCSPCVWDYFYEDRKAWKDQQTLLAQEAENTSNNDESK
ncbi:oxidoreductase-like domain-containing protein [Pseudocolwellia sp. HL-MZ7]|uniref:oxidoreductase-like domain-containing protein n=1 Tax=Pseudocolwellia sp. HL-MZ7 TaxID=3400627 RepID=UPI003CF5A672